MKRFIGLFTVIIFLISIIGISCKKCVECTLGTSASSKTCGIGLKEHKKEMESKGYTCSDIQ